MVNRRQNNVHPAHLTANPFGRRSYISVIREDHIRIPEAIVKRSCSIRIISSIRIRSSHTSHIYRTSKNSTLLKISFNSLLKRSHCLSVFKYHFLIATAKYFVSILFSLKQIPLHGSFLLVFVFLFGIFIILISIFSIICATSHILNESGNSNFLIVSKRIKYVANGLTFASSTSYITIVFIIIIIVIILFIVVIIFILFIVIRIIILIVFVFIFVVVYFVLVIIH